MNSDDDDHRGSKFGRDSERVVAADRNSSGQSQMSHFRMSGFGIQNSQISFSANHSNQQVFLRSIA